MLASELSRAAALGTSSDSNTFKKVILLMQGDSFSSDKTTATMWRVLFDGDPPPDFTNKAVISYMSRKSEDGPILQAEQWVAILDSFSLPQHISTKHSSYVSFYDGTSSRNFSMPIYASLHAALRRVPFLVGEAHIFKLMLSLCLAEKNLTEVLQKGAGRWFPAVMANNVSIELRNFTKTWPARKLDYYHPIDEETRRKMWQYEILSLLNMMEKARN
jgi:hypothetical protein